MTNFDTFFDSAKFHPERIISPDPWIGHIPFAAWLIKTNKPSVIVELGTQSGNSYLVFCQSVTEAGLSTRCFSVVTIHSVDASSLEHETVSQEFTLYHNGRYGSFSQLLRISPDEAVLSFQDGTIELLHLTGYSSYESVKENFDTWLPKLSKYCVILLDDISGSNNGVRKMWEEIKIKYPRNVAFEHQDGLGVLQLSEDPDDDNSAFLQKDSPDRQLFMSYFSSLGAALVDKYKNQELLRETTRSNLELEKRNSEQTRTIQDLQKQLEEKDKLIGSLHLDLANQLNKTQELKDTLDVLSKSWAARISLFLFQIRAKLLPPGTRREKIARWCIMALVTWRREGFRALLWKIMRLFGKIKDYPMWQRANEPNEKQLQEQRKNIRDMNNKPLISIVMPVWNCPVIILEQTILSVVTQTYDNWELCIADGNSNPETVKVLEKWSKKDNRIKIKFLPENKGIAANTNEAIALSVGEFVAFLDHDDLLAPFALYEVINTLENHSNLDIIYSDEDKTNERGDRFDPFFKPDFSPDLLRSINFMPHFLVIRKTLGDQLGWVREGFDGAQDYDLILRVVEKARDIAHISKVLYHWRVWAASTASSSSAKPYADNSGKKALQEHLERIGIAARVIENDIPTLYRVQYIHPDSPLISIIIPNRDQPAYLSRCMDSIFQKTTYPNFEIVIVENRSKEQETFLLYEKLKMDPRVRIIEWVDQFNYSLVNNWAASQVEGEVLLFLNNDIEVINSDWLEQMLQFAIRPDVGAVGAKLYYPDDTIQHAGVVLGVGGIAGHSHKMYPRNHPGYFGQLVLPRNVSANTAACLMVRKRVFQEVNGFDEHYPLAFGDVDLCLAILKKGYLNIWTPYAELYHHESKTRGYEDTLEKQIRNKKERDYFTNRWSAFIQKGDPYYNPNLTLDYEDYRIKTP